MNDVVIDTNVMVYCFDNKLDINRLLDSFFQSSFSISTIKRCIDELTVIKRPDVKSFFLSYGIKVEEFNNGKNTDDTLLEFCLYKDGILFTEDRKLREKASRHGIKVLSFNGRSVKFSSK
jgi:rRNA-processing protein FCF1